MKKLILMFMLCGTVTISVAQTSNEGDKPVRIERIQNMAEHKAQELELVGDTKSNFIVLYTQYQQDLFNVMRKEMGNIQKKKEQNSTADADTKAQARIDRFFAQQERMIKVNEGQLTIHRKYYTEFSKILSTQQLAKIFTNRPQNGNGKGQNFQRRGNRMRQ